MRFDGLLVASLLLAGLGCGGGKDVLVGEKRTSYGEVRSWAGVGNRVVALSRSRARAHLGPGVGRFRWEQNRPKFGR